MNDLIVFALSIANHRNWMVFLFGHRYITSASGEVPLGLESKEREGEGDRRAHPDRDDDCVCVELGHHRAKHEPFGH